MVKKPFLVPANPDICPRDPVTMQRLAPAGEHKELTTFWRRRIKDGDVVISKPKKFTKEDKKS